MIIKRSNRFLTMQAVSFVDKASICQLLCKDNAYHSSQILTYMLSNIYAYPIFDYTVTKQTHHSTFAVFINFTHPLIIITWSILLI
jgi:hypothetical protein